jgi:hypothetical protein
VNLKWVSFVVLSYSISHVTTTIFHHRHTLTVGSSSQIKTYVGGFSYLHCKQHHRVSYFNPAELAAIVIFCIKIILHFSLALNAYCYYGSYCEQICFQIDSINHNTPTCDCAIGYKLNNDGRTCSPKSQQYIIYSTHSLLRAFDYRSNDSAREDVMPMIAGNDMEMLSVRYSNRELYWINANRLIRRAIWTNDRTWNITNYLQISVAAQQNFILGLTLDWIAGNLYFSYISNTYGHLEVNRLGTDHRLILRKGTNETIYAIAVNPKRR